jgi:hypothetical protein
VSSETLSLSQKFLSKSVVWRSKNEKISLSSVCAVCLLADFLVHRSLKKRVFWVLFRVIHAFFRLKKFLIFA